MRLAALLLLPLLASAPVHAAPSAGQPKAAKSSDAAKKAAKAKKIAGVKTLTLKLQPTPPATPSTRVFSKTKSHPPLEAASVDKVAVSAQRPVDGGAFLLALNADIVTSEANGFVARGVHLGREGDFSVVLPRAWVGDHDLLVECTGELPDKVEGAAVLSHDHGFNTYGDVEVAPSNGAVRFLLMTADLGGGNWVRVQLHNADYQSGAYWRVDGCSVERI